MRSLRITVKRDRIPLLWEEAEQLLAKKDMKSLEILGGKGAPEHQHLLPQRPSKSP